MKIYLTKNKKLKLVFERETFMVGRKVTQNLWRDKSDIQLLDSYDFKINQKITDDITKLVNDYLEELTNQLITEENSIELNQILEERKNQLAEEAKATKNSYDTSDALSKVLEVTNGKI